MIQTNRVIRNSFFLAVFYIFASSHVYAMSPAGQGIYKQMQSEIEAIKPHVAFLKESIDTSNGSAKAGISIERLVEAAERALQGCYKISDLYGTMNAGDKKAAEVLTLFKTVQDAKLWVARAGLASPESFLSPSALDTFKNFTENIAPMLATYKEEIAAEKRRINDFENQLNRVIRVYNAFSKQDKRSPGGIAFSILLKNEAHYLKTTRAARANSATVRQEAKAKCNALSRDIKQRKGARIHLDTLISLYKKQRPNISGGSGMRALEKWLETIRAMKVTSDYLQPICSNPENQAWMKECKQTHGKPRLEGLFASTDPVVWCMVTKEFPTAIQTWVEMTQERSSTRSMRVADASKLEGNDGFLGTAFQGKLLTWDETFQMHSDQDEEKQSVYQQIYEAAGMAGEDGSGFTAGREKALAELKAEILRLAPQWKPRKYTGNFYGVSLAKQQVKRQFKGARILAAGAAGSGWKMSHHKDINSRSTHRERSGSIYFKIPGAPLCVEHGFTVMEKLNGTRYMKESSVNFGSVRWLNCP